MKALVVDDSSLMRRMLIGALGRAGITDIEEAADGKEAVSICAARNFDLILLDWNMPVMNGFDALRAIRASDESVPVIMVTSEAEKKNIVEAVKAGASSYILKPFDPELFVCKIKEIIGACQ